MKLISMTDFVLNNDSTCIYKYAKFLSQKLELWMFVPCKLVDDVWVVLEVPKSIPAPNKDRKYPNQPIFDKEEIKEYQEAKYRVLFEGFAHTNVLSDFVMHKSGWGIMVRDFEKSIIENYANERYNLELTPTAKKQIGL